VDGRPDHRNKAAFSNLSGVVSTKPHLCNSMHLYTCYCNVCVEVSCDNDNLI